MRQHFWPCTDIDLCLRQLADRDDLAVAVSRMHSRNSAHIHASQMFCFPQARGNIINYPVRMLMRPDFPHVGRVNDVIRRAFEAGLIAKWAADHEAVHGMASNSDRVTRVSDDNGNNVVLTMNHLAGAWTTVFVGLPLGTLAFFAEHLAARRVRLGIDGGRWYRLLMLADRVFVLPGRSFFNGLRDLMYLD